MSQVVPSPRKLEPGEKEYFDAQIVQAKRHYENTIGNLPGILDELKLCHEICRELVRRQPPYRHAMVAYFFLAKEWDEGIVLDENYIALAQECGELLRLPGYSRDPSQPSDAYDGTDGDQYNFMVVAVKRIATEIEEEAGREGRFNLEHTLAALEM